MQSWSAGEFDSHTTTKYKIMYETLEHWKQYKQEKALQAKIAKKLKLNEAIKEMDKFLAKLRKKNGQTNY